MDVAKKVMELSEENREDTKNRSRATHTQPFEISDVPWSGDT